MTLFQVYEFRSALLGTGGMDCATTFWESLMYKKKKTISPKNCEHKLNPKSSRTRTVFWFSSFIFPALLSFSDPTWIGAKIAAGYLMYWIYSRWYWGIGKGGHDKTIMYLSIEGIIRIWAEQGESWRGWFLLRIMHTDWTEEVSVFSNDVHGTFHFRWFRK